MNNNYSDFSRRFRRRATATVVMWAVAITVTMSTRSAAGLDFNALPSDQDIHEWLKTSSPSYREVCNSILARKAVKEIRFKTVEFEPTKFSRLGVFDIDGVYEIRISHKLKGEERVRTLAFEVANVYLHQEHQEIDAGTQQGFFTTAREYAIAHEIYEYEAWRVHRRFLADLELALGAIPPGLFYGPTDVRRVADYKLPPLFRHLKWMEESGHMKHYLDWYERYYGKTPPRLEPTKTSG